MMWFDFMLGSCYNNKHYILHNYDYTLYQFKNNIQDLYINISYRKIC